MHTLLRYVSAVAALAIAAVPLRAQSANETEQVVESDDAEIRENPDIGPAQAVSAAETAMRRADQYASYPFLNLDANRITMNGADWSALSGLLAAADDTVISIVHIGDSHIQAEGSTSKTRTLLEDRFGSAGRGLVIPFRLAGTNQPNDYTISSSSSFTSAKLLKMPWAVDMGFTGIALQPKTATFDFTISVKQTADSPPRDFDRIRVFCSGATPIVTGITDRDVPALYTATADSEVLDIALFEPSTAVTIDFQSRGECTIFGFELTNSMTGIEYSAIGNNGATYSTYNSIGTVGRDIHALSPDLVILDMGTNEAFGKITDAQFYANIDRLVENIRKANPSAAILLTTPMECQRSVTTRVRRKGKKRRYTTTRSYKVNDNVSRMRDVILRYGAEKGIAVYDWYAVAGGTGASAKWIAKGLFAKDRIHHSWSGYALQGNLLFDAFIPLGTLGTQASGL